LPGLLSATISQANAHITVIVDFNLEGHVLHQILKRATFLIQPLVFFLELINFTVFVIVLMELIECNFPAGVFERLSIVEEVLDGSIYIYVLDMLYFKYVDLHH